MYLYKSRSVPVIYIPTMESQDRARHKQNSSSKYYDPSASPSAGEPLLKKAGNRRGVGVGVGGGGRIDSPRGSRRRRNSNRSLGSRGSSCSLNGSIRDSTIPKTFLSRSRASSCSSLTGSIRDSTIPRTGLEIVESWKMSRHSPY